MRNKKRISMLLAMFTVLGLMFSSISFGVVDGKGHGYHYIRATNRNFSQVYGHAQIPTSYASSEVYQTYPEIFYGMYAGGSGLDVGILSQNGRWYAFAGVLGGASETGKYAWYNGSEITGLGAGNNVYLEAKVEKEGTSYYLVLYAKKDGSFYNKTQVLKARLNSTWGKNVYDNGATINREISLASNDNEYLTKSQAYLYNAKWIDAGCVTPSGVTYSWTDSITSYKGMFNDDGVANSKYYSVQTGTQNGYATETVSIYYNVN